MKIMVDLDPKDVWRIQEMAERRGVTPGEVMRDEMTRTRHGRDFLDAVRARVKTGMCDADIAADLVWPTVGTVAAARRGMGLPANRRYRRAT
jgi:hypothetical protein